jgi:hypothetical protein
LAYRALRDRGRFPLSFVVLLGLDLKGGLFGYAH